jgi:predicted heme/steroid binding protein
MPEKRNKHLIYAAVLSVSAVVLILNIYTISRFKPREISLADIQKIGKVYTGSELQKFNGTDAKLPIYLAMDGYVYDVTNGRDFYAPGGPYHYLAGKDSSADLHIAGGSIIRAKYPIVGIFRGK